MQDRYTTMNHEALLNSFNLITFLGSLAKNWVSNGCQSVGGGWLGGVPRLGVTILFDHDFSQVAQTD